MPPRRIIHYGFTPATTGAGLLAANPPKYAYGLAKIHPSATISGTCIRSDGATQTIGFVGNDLDTTAIATFCGALQGGFFMAEQSGSGYDTSIQTFSDAPLIYNGSSILTEPINGKPALYFPSQKNQDIICPNTVFKFLHDGTLSAFFIQASAGFSANPNAAYSYFGNNNATTAQRGALVAYDNRGSVPRSDALVVQVTRAAFNQPPANPVEQNFITPMLPHLISCFLDVSNATPAQRVLSAVDGSATVGTNTFSFPPSNGNCTNANLAIGGISTSSVAFPFLGYYQSIIFYDTDQLANKSAIETPLIAYYA